MRFITQGNEALTVSVESRCCWSQSCHCAPVGFSLSQQELTHMTGLGSASCVSVELDQAPWMRVYYCCCSEWRLRHCGLVVMMAGWALSSGCSCGSAASSRFLGPCPAAGPGSPGWPGLAASRAPRCVYVEFLEVWPGSRWCYWVPEGTPQPDLGCLGWTP